MAEGQAKHEARREAHEAGVEGASKMSTEDARKAAREVEHGANRQKAKQDAEAD